MFPSQDADVILKMELIFKKKAHNREENKSWLSPSLRPTTVAAVPLNPIPGKNLSLGVCLTGDGSIFEQDLMASVLYQLI